MYRPVLTRHSKLKTNKNKKTKKEEGEEEKGTNKNWVAGKVGKTGKVGVVQNQSNDLSQWPVGTTWIDDDYEFSNPSGPLPQKLDNHLGNCTINIMDSDTSQTRA